MSRLFYSKLAATNIKKNGRIYIPYILTCIFTISMFYIMLFLSLNKGIREMPSGADVLFTIMILGTIVIGIFSVIILLYSNSFLMKRRKKELGLYNILGMGKGHIARVMILENIYVAVLTLVIGLGVGILLSKLMLMILLKILTFKVTFGFEVPPIAIGVTLLLFLGIFLVTLLINLGRVHLSKPIELLYGGSVGEKEPKTKWLLAIIGFLMLGAGYYIAITTESPLDALALFFVAVILVILGTYCLFTAGSIAFLKALRKNKRYYYKTKHFTSVSGMIYRMKQNAVGLANICILSTMVLVMLSGTVSLYLGMEDALRNMYPRNIEVSVGNATDSDIAIVTEHIEQAIADSGVETEGLIRYAYKSGTFYQEGSSFSFDRNSPYASEMTAVLALIPLSEYNRMQNSDTQLRPDEAMLYAPGETDIGQTVTINDRDFHVTSIGTLDVEQSGAVISTETLYFIVPDTETILDIFKARERDDDRGLDYYFGLDVVSGNEDEIALVEIISNTVSGLKSQMSTDSYIYTESAEGSKSEFLAIYGGLFFLGIFLGVLFIMATVLIMYYKQVSEGYDDKKRFEIMQKVGLSRDEVKETIRSQVLTVFFLPLIAACIHIAAAFKMITKLLLVLNLTNVELFAWCTAGTILIFALIYGAVYALTARAYYKIVS
jgi:putative ABC transport system permease protein